jgi:hypothetical protein
VENKNVNYTKTGTEVIKLEGDNPRLYYLVAHLAMNETVLAYNLNYPYKTSPEHRWYVASKDGETLGFLPVRCRKGLGTINNYYVVNDDQSVFALLIRELMWDLSADYIVEAVVHLRHEEIFAANGFIVNLWWKRYARMMPSQTMWNGLTRKKNQT